MKARWIDSNGNWWQRLLAYLFGRRVKWVLYLNGDRRQGRMRAWCINPEPEDFERMEAVVSDLVEQGWEVVHRPRPLEE